MKEQTRIFFVDADPEDVNHSVGYLKKLFNSRPMPFVTLQKTEVKDNAEEAGTVEKDIVVNINNITKFEAL